jgi:Zn-dependent protease
MTLGTTNIIVIIVVLIVSITLHEAMHAFTSHWLGDDTAQIEGRISLNPLRHIDPFATILLPLISLVVFGFPILAAKPVPFNPSRVKYEEFGAALVGIAGPLTNLVLAILAAIFLRGIGTNVSRGVYDVAYTFVQLNILLFVFNMIPIPPLDGSRLLYAFAPETLQSAMAQLEQFGIFIVFGLVLLVPAFSSLLINIDQAVLKLIL